MRLKLTTAAVTAVTCISLLGAAGASASTEAGSKCQGNTGGGGNTFVGTSNAAGLPATIPVAGVITRWTFNVVTIPPSTYSASLKIFRRTGTPKQFQVIADSGSASLNGGLNSFPTRIPVQSGDLIGTFGTQMGSPFTIVCSTGNPGDKAAVLEGNPSVGSTATELGEGTAIQVPITVSVEPDADNDGFGDETQDLCPTSAAIQAIACPPVVLSTSSLVKKGLVTVIVTSNTTAPVTVKGVANLGKGKKAKLNGGIQNMLPGTLTKFKLFFTKGLKNKLKELDPSKKLTLKVTVSGTSVAGVVTTNTLKLKLKGQAKP